MKSIRNFLIGIKPNRPRIVECGDTSPLSKRGHVRAVPKLLLFGAALTIAGYLLHAQETAMPVQSGSIPLATNIDWDSASDLQVLLQAVEMTPTIPATNAPRAATFYSALHAPGTKQPWPPLPMNARQTPLWNLGDNVFLMSDVNVDYNTPVHSSATMAGGTMTMDAQGGGMYPNGSTNIFVPSFQFTPNYGTNLWIAQPEVASNYFSGFVSNSFADIPYEIQYKTDLGQTNWQSANWFVYGSELTNWTPFSLMAGSPTNLFLRVRSWQDDGSGLPIWWQEQYFGTNGVDPYGNPAGDGWNNLQKFRNGMNPNVFYTPPAPQGLTVNYNNINNTAAISWSPSPGPVESYTIETPSGNQTVPATTLTFTDTSTPTTDWSQGWHTGPTAFGSYRVYANYAGGSSALSEQVDLEPDSSSYNPTIPIYLIPGPQGSAYVAASSLPAGTVALRVTRFDEERQVFGLVPYHTNFDIPVSNITNGLYLIPSQWYLTPGSLVGGGSSRIVDNAMWWVQAVNTNGGLSAGISQLDYAWHSPYRGFWGFPENTNFENWLVAPYFDGRAQLKQNLIFKLRAATRDFPFEFSDRDGYGFHPAYTNQHNYVLADYFQNNPTFDFGYGNFTFDPLWPIAENYRFRNFVFSVADAGPTTNYVAYGLGHLTTGDGGSYDDYYNWPYHPTPLILTEPAKYQFALNPTNGTTIPALLDVNSTWWLGAYPLDSSESYYDPGSGMLVSSGHLGEIGITNYFDDQWNEYYTLFSSARNYWGLPFVSVLTAYDDGTGMAIATNVLSAGNTTLQDGYFYPQTAQPQLQTAEYDFWNSPVVFQPVVNSWPGNNGFSTTNTGNLLITAIGNPNYQVLGYAKLSVLNGYSGVYGYLGQYFDTAYKITNGIVTTNTSGLLSPYGQFFATEPGPAALVTMPDIDTGQRGTGVVYCASLQVDKNHDGVMDLSFSGADATAAGNPMRFWVNSGWDDQNGVDRPNYGNTNYMDAMINWPRDLENFARLWVCGVPALPSAQGYSVTLSWQNVSGSPAVNLFRSVETDGGIGYLTDTNVAAAQTVFTLPNGSGLAFAQVQTGTTFTFPADFFDGTNKYFLFEGAGIGEGELTLTISQNGNTIAQTGVWLDLHDIKDLYEQAHIAPATSAEMLNTTNASTFVSDHEVAPSSDELKQMVVFVHGWRLGLFDYRDFSDTMFKRLYWQNYHGRFASLRWPTLSSDDFKYFSDAQGYLTYNRSEYIAFRSAQGASDYFDWLKSRFPDYSVNVAAHSMGNIVMMEALKLQLAAGHKAIDNYVLMQGAVPAHCYDADAPLQPSLVAQESEQPTPNTYLNYPGAINGALNGSMVNIFNTNDFALNFWIGNQFLNKPDSTQGYYIVPPVQPYKFPSTLVTDPREIMAFVARPRSFAVGAQSDVQGVMLESRQIDLLHQFGFTDAPTDHSGEFNRNIQNTAPFYQTLLNTLFPPQ